MKNNKGITLASLVLTIIVLLILASIFVYSGVNTVRYTKFNKAKSEISVVQTNVNSWYQELKNVENTDEYKALQTDDEKLQYKNNFLNDKGYGVTTDDPACSQKKLDDTLQGLNDKGIEIENFDNYRFLSSKFLENKFGLNASYDFLANIEDRTVILFGGLEYNGEWYYTMEDFGLTNIKSNTISGITFDLAQGDNTEIVISNLKMTDNENNKIDFSKFIVEYKKKGEANWTDITKDIVKFEDGEDNNKTTKFKFKTSDIGEYKVKISTIDKRFPSENEVEIYEKKLTVPAPPKICVSTLDYTASSETDDSKILTIDGAMLLSAGEQAVPSRIENDKYVWRSSNTNVATVTTDGVVKCGTEAGTAIITLIGANNTKCLCKVKTTAKIADSNIKIDSNYTINGAEGTHLNPTIPAGFYAINTNITEATEDNIEWDLTGNQTKTGKGLVIMNDAGDQFVWVPVKKDEVVLDTTNHTTPSTSAVTVTSDFYTPMATTYTYNGKIYYRGMLYTFAGDTTSTTVKYNSGYNVGTTSYREPSLVTGNSSDKWAPMTSVTGSTYDAQYYTKAGFTETQGVTGFGAKMQEDYDEMIRQVQAYGGFWVGRYESSWNDKTKKVASVAGTKSFTNADKSDRDEANMWYGLYRTHKAYSNNSSMIWGSQYDAMMNWMAKNGITVGTNIVMSGTARNVGNNATNGQRITGNPKYNDKLSNVIDIYGNSYEWILEANSTNCRAFRGGGYKSSVRPSNRYGDGCADYSGGNYASRLSLYIK